MAQRSWCGSSPEWSISGFVSTTEACLRAHVRSSGLASPSYAAAVTPGKSRAVRARSWSWASALVGKRMRAVPGRIGAAAASAIGTW